MSFGMIVLNQSIKEMLNCVTWRRIVFSLILKPKKLLLEIVIRNSMNILLMILKKNSIYRIMMWMNGTFN